MNAKKNGPDHWTVVTWLLVVAVLAVLLLTTSITEAEPPKETDRWAQFAAQEEYYRVVELYGDTKGAVDAARIVFEREEATHAED